MRPGVWLAVAASFAVASGVAVADDADLIPQGVLAPTAAPPVAAPGAKVFVEDAITASAIDHDVVVPAPPALGVAWQNRASVDGNVQWKPFSTLALTLSDRLNVYVQDQQAVLSRGTVRNDFREGYLTWQPHTDVYLEAGRINVRNGVGLGFNPTDFFKTRTLVGQSSLDPSVIRQNRLGALMVRGQAIWGSASATLAFAPKVAAPSAIAGDSLGLDPQLSATNAANRWLATFSFEVLDLSPQLLGYLEHGRSKVGINLSRALGDAIVAYGEWAGGPEQNLAARAFAFGAQTGTFPAGAPPPFPINTARAFRNDVNAGLSWTIATKVTLNVEYHYHEAGFGRGAWSDWFDLPAAAPPGLAAERWYLRGYASDQQEPVTRHEAFVRADWPRAFVPDLELSAFTFVDLLDGSALSQAAASYYLSNQWTASWFVSTNLGSTRSERGSFPDRVSAIAQLTWYL